ncbi:hypothetical protein FOL47_008152 [Perkinsus chesapeaki]|uniref:Uncharacterized protein n=1 Tax=Perkinsus chesapeaki TaxID=330153 RepID=A0A7J6LFR8_PERCH|nr:hypothetical protein FOL47_008152 [Perkinsus chesapeaki]
MLSSFHNTGSTTALHTAQPMDVDGGYVMGSGEDILRNMDSLHLDGGSSPINAADNTAVLPLNDPITPVNTQMAIGRRSGRKEKDSEYTRVRRQIMMPYVLSGRNSGDMGDVEDIIIITDCCHAMDWLMMQWLYDAKRGSSFIGKGKRLKGNSKLRNARGGKCIAIPDGAAVRLRADYGRNRESRLRLLLTQH